MSGGQILSGIGGGVAGYLISGGNPLGAYYGFTLGIAVGTFLDPPSSDLGKPEIGKLEVTTAKEGDPIPEILGTTKITGNIIHYYGERTEEVTEEAGGCGGGDEYVSGYKYYMSLLIALCMGPVDKVLTIYYGDDAIWSGELLRPESGGMAEISVSRGDIEFYFGTADHAVNSTIGASLEDSTLNTPYRNLCYIHLKDFHIGTNTDRPETVYVVLSKFPVLPFNNNHIIGNYFYNPIHAIYYIFVVLTGLNPNRIDTDSLSEAADYLYNEGTGISINMGSRATAKDYLLDIAAHIRGSIRYDRDTAKIQVELFRDVIDISEIDEITDDYFLEAPSVKKPTIWNTKNNVTVNHPLMVFDTTEDEDDCDTPALVFVRCSEYKLVDRIVIAVDGNDILVDNISTVNDLDGGGYVHYFGEEREITAFSVDAINNRITLTLASAFTGLEAGDSIVVETVDEKASESCLYDGIYYITGDLCGPLTLELSDGGAFESKKYVNENFSARCTNEEDKIEEYRIKDIYEQVSCDAYNDSDCVALEASTGETTWDIAPPDTIGQSDNSVFSWTGAVGLTTVVVTGNGAYVNQIGTNSITTYGNTATLITDATACGPIAVSVIDLCGDLVKDVRCDSGIWDEDPYFACESAGEPTGGTEAMWERIDGKYKVTMQMIAQCGTGADTSIDVAWGASCPGSTNWVCGPDCIAGGACSDFCIYGGITTASGHPFDGELTYNWNDYYVETPPGCGCPDGPSCAEGLVGCHRTCQYVCFCVKARHSYTWICGT